MLSFLLRRLLTTVPLLLGISIVLFGLLHLIPGGPETVAASPQISERARLNMVTALGLDRPLPEQYIKWLWGTLHLNFGNTYRGGQPVATVIGDRLPATLELLGVSSLVSLARAIPMGIAGAVRQYSTLDYLLTLISYLGISMPVFWLAEILLLAFAVQRPWFPTGGNATVGVPPSLWDAVHHLVLPVIVLTLFFVAGWSRYLRAGMLEVLHQDYLRTARAKGLTRARVVLKHALRNALIPLVTVVALDVGSIFGGAVVTEQVFGWPGLGLLFFDSLGARDYPVLMAMLALSAAAVVLFNLLADLLYGLIDPRIRYR